MKTGIQNTGMNEDQEQVAVKRDSSKIYFFIIAIAALLATNIYFYVKFKSSGEKLYTVTLQKESLQSEIDRIEAELDNIRSQSNGSTEDFQSAEQVVRLKIEELRNGLESGEITDEQIENAKQQVYQLKTQVSRMKDEVTELRIKNELLAEANSDLKNEVTATRQRSENLSKETKVLNEKINKASSIKVSNIHIAGIEEKKGGVIEIETKSKRIDKLQISFTVADNPLASTGKKDIFVRVINPKGNLEANSEDIFYVHGEKLQYSFKQSINFTNNGQEYQMEWGNNGERFQKGAYTILLYADNSIMGRASIVLK
ncbi:MAG: hypothetical protein ACI35Z_16195 [Sphingobacterium hotanense]